MTGREAAIIIREYCNEQYPRNGAQRYSSDEQLSIAIRRRAGHELANMCAREPWKDPIDIVERYVRDMQWCVSKHRHHNDERRRFMDALTVGMDILEIFTTATDLIDVYAERRGLL